MSKHIEGIIFIVAQKFTKRDFRRYGIEKFKTNKFKVKVWDITAILYPDVERLYFPLDIMKDEKLITKFSKINLLINSIKSQNKNTFFNVELIYSWKTFKIFNVISKNSFKYTCLVPPKGGMPYSENRQDSQSIIYKKKIKRLFNFKNLFRAIFNRIPVNILGLNSPDFVIVSCGEDSIIKSSIISKKTKVLKVFSPDYEQYYLDILAGDKDDITENTIVFIDQNLPNAMDAFYDGNYKDNKITSEIYYEEINSLFDNLENFTGLKVIIAAHPKLNIENDNLFHGRKVVRNNTYQSIKKSKLVIGHYSSAINIAILLNKPIFLFTTKSISDHGSNHFIESFTNSLGIKFININDDNFKLDKFEIFNINDEKYKSFINRYIKSDDTINKPVWNAYIDNLRELRL